MEEYGELNFDEESDYSERLDDGFELTYDDDPEDMRDRHPSVIGDLRFIGISKPGKPIRKKLNPKKQAA